MKLIYLSIIIFFASVLHADEQLFKFTLGGQLGNFPLEINKINKNKKKLMGLKVNDWILSPNIFFYEGSKYLSSFSDNKNFKDKVYLKLNFKF